MHVGLSMIFQNLSERDDRTMMCRELDIISRAEALGFESIWVPEHHFAGYTVAPNVPQLLAWIAARTERLR
ncbi:MAG TPA: LLM class flavin-dependent oxidoreductase, partial [Ilumatobacteraceae bacterium]|nr:LLM class flavin-dependent oxidoreductase [Ilumatobacteraceae bacterium]